MQIYTRMRNKYDRVVCCCPHGNVFVIVIIRGKAAYIESRLSLHYKTKVKMQHALLSFLELDERFSRYKAANRQ